MEKKHKTGTLFLLPSDFGEGTHTEKLIPPVVREIVSRCVYFITENVRTTRRFMRRIGYEGDFDTLDFKSIGKHDEISIREMLNPALEGSDICLLSEAGTPCVADPGAAVVAEAHKLGIRVTPVSGPSSVLMTLSASGLNGQRFSFEGYLPVKTGERRQAILSLEKLSADRDQSVFFIETPFRNDALLQDLLKHCRDNTQLTIGCEVGISGGWVKTLAVASWKKKPAALHKKMCVFGIQAILKQNMGSR